MFARPLWRGGDTAEHRAQGLPGASAARQHPEPAGGTPGEPRLPFRN